MAGFTVGNHCYVRTDVYDVAGTVVHEVQHVLQNSSGFNQTMATLGVTGQDLSYAREMLAFQAQQDFQTAAGKDAFNSDQEMYDHIFDNY